MAAIRNVKTASGIVHIACKGQGRITKTAPKMWNVDCRSLKGTFAQGTSEEATCRKCIQKHNNGNQHQARVASAHARTANSDKFGGGVSTYKIGKAKRDASKVVPTTGLGSGPRFVSSSTMPVTMTDWNAMLASAPVGFGSESLKTRPQIKKLIHKPEYDGSFPVAKFQGIAYDWTVYLSNDDKSFIAVLHADGPMPKANHRYAVRTWTHGNDASKMFAAWMHMCTTLALDTGSSVYSEMQ